MVATRLLLSFAVAWGALPARAAELVTLQNGFTVHCASRETLSTGLVRLHMSGGSSGIGNYMDVPVASIATVEAAADIAFADNALTLPAEAKRDDLHAITQRSAEVHHLNVALLNAVIHAESAGNARAVSRTGARGLMQLMPGTANQLGVTDSFSPEANINGGSTYLDQLLTRYHENISLALAAYNAGPAAVDRYHGMPPYPETQRYVAKVIRMWNSLVAVQSTQPVADRVASR